MYFLRYLVRSKSTVFRGIIQDSVFWDGNFLQFTQQDVTSAVGNRNYHLYEDDTQMYMDTLAAVTEVSAASNVLTNDLNSISKCK